MSVFYFYVFFNAKHLFQCHKCFNAKVSFFSSGFIFNAKVKCHCSKPIQYEI